MNKNAIVEEDVITADKNIVVSSGGDGLTVLKKSGRMYGPESDIPDSLDNTQSPSQRDSTLSAKASALASAAVAMKTVSIPSNVLALAQDLQKVMQKNGSQPSGQDQQTHEIPGHNKNRASSNNKLTLQELTAKKRVSVQRLQDDANIAATRLKLIGGLKALDEENETEETRSGSVGLRSNKGSRIGDGDNNDDDNVGSVQRSRIGGEREDVMESTLKMLLQQCPFLEECETGRDSAGRKFVTLKGYTETDDGWKKLQSAFEQFLGGPLKDQRSALPPEDTLIPSYHSPRLPEVRLSEKALKFLRAKDRVTTAAELSGSASNIDETTQLCTTTSTPANTTEKSIGLSSGRQNSKNSGTRRWRSQSLMSSIPVPVPVPVVTPTPAPTFKPVATALAQFSRHSVQLTGGVGYGPGKTFTDLGNKSNSSNNGQHGSTPRRFAEGYAAIEESSRGGSTTTTRLRPVLWRKSKRRAPTCHDGYNLLQEEEVVVEEMVL
ncbi:hypothetical protein BGZ65_006753 [Modicella reniformis]|uniref:Uncharacterized protein n=1 Tax=Modicella reniformis TaxID=1440133 RepID=A0A9P6MB47_9FUNG|nr:hypothetical protein BGZ65_006753 [Modicella reniformis]